MNPSLICFLICSLRFASLSTLTSLGSNQTFLLPHFKTEAASLLCNFNDTYKKRGIIPFEDELFDCTKQSTYHLKSPSSSKPFLLIRKSPLLVASPLLQTPHCRLTIQARPNWARSCRANRLNSEKAPRVQASVWRGT